MTAIPPSYAIIEACKNCGRRRGYFEKRGRGNPKVICRACNLPYFQIATPAQIKKYRGKPTNEPRNAKIWSLF